MTEQIKQQLIERNNRIISDITEKAKKLCPDSVALIGVAGSFCSGDFHEKSDLDPFIVINDDNGWRVASCFIMGDVAHDIYCTYWGQLEEMAEYNNPYVIKLMSIDFSYCADPKYMEKYMALRKKLTDKLSTPFDNDDLDKCEKHFKNALQCYAKLMMNDETAECRYASLGMIYYIEFVIYMINKSYIKLGVKRIPEEICKLEKLPDNFCEYYMETINAQGTEEIKAYATKLIKSVKSQLEDEKAKLSNKNKITSDELSGTYEEIFSNWKNKMRLAAENNDVYLSVMSAQSCQEIYNDLYNEFDIEKIDLMKNISTNTKENAVAFDNAMEKVLLLYKKNNTKLCRFKDIDEFESFYCD